MVDQCSVGCAGERSWYFESVEFHGFCFRVSSQSYLNDLLLNAIALNKKSFSRCISTKMFAVSIQLSLLLQL